MGFFDGIVGDATKAIGRFKNKGTLERIAAVAALVAYLPDHDADKQEVSRAVRIINASTDGVFEVAEMQAAVNKHVDTLKLDDDVGKQRLLNLIKPAIGTDEASILVATAVAVGKSSGDFSDGEREVAADVAKFLKLNPADFGI